VTIRLFLALLGLTFLAAVGAGNARAESTDARLARIETKLDDMDKKLGALLEGQKQNEEEHTQMRYWIKRA